MAGRNTYEDSDHFGGSGPRPTARVFVLSHRALADTPTDRLSRHCRDRTRGRRGSRAADDKDVGFMGAVATAALQAGLVDELILHEAPVLFGAGRPFFHAARTSAPLSRRCHPDARDHPPSLPGRTVNHITGGVAPSDRIPHGTRDIDSALDENRGDHHQTQV